VLSSQVLSCGMPRNSRWYRLSSACNRPFPAILPLRAMQAAPAARRHSSIGSRIGRRHSSLDRLPGMQQPPRPWPPPPIDPRPTTTDQAMHASYPAAARDVPRPWTLSLVWYVVLGHHSKLAGYSLSGPSAGSAEPIGQREAR